MRASVKPKKERKDVPGLNRLPQGIQDRISTAKTMGVRGDFLGKDYHVCRFCGTPIRQAGSMMPLANFAQMYLPLESGAHLSVNGCSDCFRLKDFSNPDLIEAVIASTFEGWTKASMDRGEPVETLAQNWPKLYRDVNARPVIHGMRELAKDVKKELF